MGVSYIKPNEAGAVQWPFECGEDLSAGDPIYAYDDLGTAKVKKVYSALNNIATAFKGYYHHSCMVAPDKVVVVYRDNLNSGKPTVRCGNVQPDNSVVWGSSVIVFNAYGYYLHIDKVNEDKFVVIYRGTGAKGSAKIGNVSGTFISLGSEYQFSVGYGYDQTCCYVSNDKFCAGFRDAGMLNHGYCRIGTCVGGTTIVWGTALEHGSTSSYENWVCVPDPATEKIAVFYRRAVGTTQAWCRASLVSGTTLSGFGAETKVGEYPYYSCAESIDTDKCAYFYRDTSDGNKAKCIIVTFTGTTVNVNLGDVIIVDGHAVYYNTLCKLADDEFMLAWTHYVSPYSGMVCKCTVSGTLITKGMNQIFMEDRTYYNSLCRLSDTKYFLVWYDTVNTVSNYIVVEGELNLLDYTIGLMQEAGLLGETKNVDIIGGISEQFVGLITGSHYYIQSDATISAVHSSYPIGIALRSDSLLVTKAG